MTFQQPHGEKPSNKQFDAGTSDLAGGGLVLFRGFGSTSESEKSTPKIVLLFQRSVLLRFSVFFRSHRLAQAPGPNNTTYSRVPLVQTYPTTYPP